MTREATELLQVQAIDPVPLETTIAGYTRVVSDHRPVRVTTIPVLPAAR